MAFKKKLTLKQELFVHEYLIDLNATQAAIRSGYSPRTACSIGYENLRKPQIAGAIQRAAVERLERINVDADWVLQKAVELVRRCMQKEPVMEKVDGEWVATGEWKFDSSGAARALEIVGKHTAVNAFKPVDDGCKPIDQNWTVTIVHTSKEEYDRRKMCIEHNP